VCVHIHTHPHIYSPGRKVSGKHLKEEELFETTLAQDEKSMKWS